MKVMTPIFAIAFNTIREAARNKILGSLVAFMIVLPLFTKIFGEMSVHQEARLAVDTTIFVSTMFGVIVTIYSTVSLLQLEIQQRTIYTILSKPIARWQFVVGKFMGVVGLLSIIVPFLFGVSLFVMWVQGAEVTPTYLWAFFTAYLQMVIVAALAILFASVASPLLAGFSTAAIFVAGNLFTQIGWIRSLLEEQKSGFVWIVDVLEWILPNLESLNLSSHATYGVWISPSYILHAIAYTVAYTGICVTLSVIATSRREFA